MDKKAGKNKSGGLNEKGRRSYERENPGQISKHPVKRKVTREEIILCKNERYEKETYLS